MSRIIALIAVPIALVSIIYNVVQYQFATNIQAEVEKLQQDYSAMVENNDSSKEDIMELNNKISKLISEYKTLEDRYNVNKKMYDIQKEYLDWYEGHIALINNFNGNCAYHTISCSKLDDSFYIFAEKEAIDRGCWECEVCHLY